MVTTENGRNFLQIPYNKKPKGLIDGMTRSVKKEWILWSIQTSIKSFSKNIFYFWNSYSIFDLKFRFRTKFEFKPLKNYKCCHTQEAWTKPHS